jgi:NADH-quinone oxidoreductase subunit L
MHFAWLCIFSPLLGSALTPLLARIHPKLRDFGAVFFSFVSAYSALRLLPLLLHPEQLPVESAVAWLSFPIEISFGVLVDPLSIILANVVAVISFFIMIYCMGYMKGDPAITRFWMWMNAFIGSMLLLVLSNNLLFIFIGWKLVGICSYGLIGFYYKDEEKYWIGGPAPTKFVTPSQAGLKALVTTGVGDLLMLGGILIVFFYSKSLNLLTIYQTMPQWLPEMTKSPGIVVLVSVLLLAGPIGKSAQFPLHEWLPEAMAGPGPVSALIHAATMVKSGVYLVARFIPIFYYGYWVLGSQEASLFFVLIAWVGVITAFIAASQGMVSLELKKALAYSTVSQIGYMMLALGVSGFSPNMLIGGYTSGIFHLVSHALFKACLFLCAGTVIHTAHSIYMPDMGHLRKYNRLTWIFMTIAALSLAGVPPFPGFWSKDAVLLSVMDTSLPLFILALITVVITSFYTVRFIGMVFYGPESDNIQHLKQKSAHLGDGSTSMLIACGVLAVMILVMGALGLKVEQFIELGFQENLIGKLGLPAPDAHDSTNHVLVIILADVCVILGAIPAFLIYFARKVQPTSVLDSFPILKVLHHFFWERWYIDSFYNRVFVNGFMGLSNWVVKFENGLDLIVHTGLPRLVTANIYDVVKHLRTETRVLSVNVTYILIAFIFFVGFFFLAL